MIGQLVSRIKKEDMIINNHKVAIVLMSCTCVELMVLHATIRRLF